MFRVIVLAAIVALAPMSQAMAAAPPASVAEMNRLLAQVADYSAPHQAALVETSELISATIAGMDPIIAAGDTRIDSETTGRQVDVWAADLQVRIAALKARRAALPPYPKAVIERLLAYDPTMRSRVDSYRQVKVECEKAIDAAIAYAESAIPATRAAVGGDADALVELVVTTFEGMKLTLAAENAMLDISISSAPPRHPQTALARSIRNSNRAIEVYLDYLMASFATETPSAAASAKAAAEMERLLATARTEAGLVASLAKALEPEMRAIPDAATRGRFLRLIATYEGSGKAELEVIAVISDAAAMLAAGKTDTDELDAALAKLDAPINRRLALQTQRLALLKP